MADCMSSYAVGIVPSDELHKLLTKWHKGKALTGRLLEIIKAYITSRRISKAKDNVLLPLEAMKLIDQHRKDIPGAPRVHQLMRGCQLQFSSPEVPPRNPELERRVQRLVQEQENRDYKDMTKDVDTTYRAKHVNEFRTDVTMLKSQLIGALNFVITVGACFLFGYKAVEYSIPIPHLPAQVLAGLFTAIIGAIADLYFLLKKLD